MAFSVVRPARSSFHAVRAAPARRRAVLKVIGGGQRTDRYNPDARSYAKMKLQQLVNQGVLPSYLPQWNADPAAAWRAVSSMVYKPQTMTPARQMLPIAQAPPGSLQGLADVGNVDFTPLDQLIAAALAKRQAQGVGYRPV